MRDRAVKVTRTQIAAAGHVGVLAKYRQREDVSFFLHRIDGQELVVVVGKARIGGRFTWLTTHGRTPETDHFQVLPSELILASDLVIRN